MQLPLEILQRRAAAHPFPLLFATISGAHLYGFPSPDSDFDLRGAHILPPRAVLGLATENETVELSSDPKTDPDHLEFDIVSHDIKKFFTLLLRKNGYVLEQLYSPLIVQTCAEHEELKEIAKGCITRHHSHHYLGFTETQWTLFARENPRRVKPLLYVYRVLLTGIHLMRTGVIEANLLALNEEFRLPFIPELVARKLAGPEQGTLPEGDFAFHEGERVRLEGELREAHEKSSLPDVPSAGAALNDLLIRLRLGPRG
ncbi:MAG TPA: nucleotidyltransferase domain-containing protein [Phycisphaerae bacterium]|nr:nucleotidyltransferase domain-containing protein [Phycisphaerae bacterium]